jgi:hypothetical protein
MKLGGGAVVLVFFGTIIMFLGLMLALYFENKQKEESFQVCIQAKNSPQECSDAVHGSLKMNWKTKDTK